MFPTVLCNRAAFREESVGSSGGVKRCYSCFRIFFFPAETWQIIEISISVADMRLLKGLSGLCLSIPALQ